jgi:hypothetical protein
MTNPALSSTTISGDDPVARHKKKCPLCGDRHYDLDALSKHGWLSDEEMNLVGDVFTRLTSKHDPSVMNPVTKKNKAFCCYLTKHLFRKHILRDGS